MRNLFNFIRRREFDARIDLLYQEISQLNEKVDELQVQCGLLEEAQQVTFRTAELLDLVEQQLLMPPTNP